MSRALKDCASVEILPRSFLIVRSSAAGCSAIYWSINDIGVVLVFGDLFS